MGLNEPQQPDPQEQAITDNILIQTEKAMSDIETQEAKAETDRMKVEDARENQIDQLALQMAELEQKYQVQLDSEVATNRLVFDPAIGDFV
jgi:predicted neutral ceramidase superfamily lipid hydrolase